MGKKKGLIIGGIIGAVAVVVAVVLCVVFIGGGSGSDKAPSDAPAENKPAELNTVEKVSTALRKNLFEASSFTMDFEVERGGYENELLLMVSYGDDFRSSAFYMDNGYNQVAMLDGFGYDGGYATELTDDWFASLDDNMSYVAEDFDSQAVFADLLSNGVSEAEFEKLYNKYNYIILSVLMGGGKNSLPEYDAVQKVLSEFLNGDVSKEAFAVSEDEGECIFIINTEAFLTELLEFAQTNETVSEYYKLFGLEGREEDLKSGISYYAEHIPTITVETEINSKGYISSMDVELGEYCDINIEFKDINNTVIDKAMCEAIPDRQPAQDAATAEKVYVE